MGLVPLPENILETISFGDFHPSFTEEAPYLGVIWDSELKLVSFMTDQAKKASRMQFQVLNHARDEVGATPATLHILFHLYVLPILIYGCELYIFSLKKYMIYGKSIRSAYRRAFNKLNKVYMTCARRILGAPLKTSHNAILVRLGWLPLEYVMMYRCLILTIKAKRGLSGTAMQSLFMDIETYRMRNSRLTRIFGPAMVNLNRLASYNSFGTNFDVDSMSRVKHTLRDCMYVELTEIWSRSCVASVTREIHPDWQKQVLPNSMLSRLSHVRFHCAALNRCPLRKRLALMKKVASSSCRYGCNVEEDLNHVLFCCPKVKQQRDAVTKICTK